MIGGEGWQIVFQGFRDFDPTATLNSRILTGCLPGFEDGDWPDWPEQYMMRWLPAEVCCKYAIVH